VRSGPLAAATLGATGRAVAARRLVSALAAATLGATGLAAPAVAQVVRDRTVTASTDDGGADPAGDARHAAISASGRVVAFDADTTTLGEDGNGAVRDVFVRDLVARRTLLASRADGGPAGDGDSTDPALSADGATVAFLSAATNLAGTDANGTDDVFDEVFKRHDRRHAARRAVATPFVRALIDDQRQVAVVSPQPGQRLGHGR